MTVAIPSTVADVDLSDADFFVHGSPHDAWRILRANDPVHWNPPSRQFWAPLKMDIDFPGFWNITKYEDVFTISRDPATFISSPGIALGPDIPEHMQDAGYNAQGRMLIMADPPHHTKLRQLVNKGFTPRTIGRLEEHIRAIATDIIDKVASRGECDFVVDVSAQLPLAVICEMLGIPQADWQFMFDITNRAIGGGDPEYQQEDTNIMQSQMEAFGYFNNLIMDRRQKERTERGEDLVQLLVGSEIDGQVLDDIDILLFCFLLVIAGNETTRNATTHGMLALMERPAERERLLADPSLMNSTIEEVLRWASPVMHMTRTATKDVELRGKQIKAGQRVAMWYTSANRDEDVFPEPYKFDVGRTPNEHLAFGVGEHFCLGANLARLELRVIFEELLRRTPDMSIAGPAERLRSNFIGGIKHLPVKFTPA